jgi:hypothetical protein
MASQDAVGKIPRAQSHKEICPLDRPVSSTSVIYQFHLYLIIYCAVLIEFCLAFT